MATTLRATYKSHGDFWTGVVKNETGAVVWACPHVHRNREQSSRSHPSAVDCARTRMIEMAQGDDGRGFIDGRARWLGGRVEVRP